MKSTTLFGLATVKTYVKASANDHDTVLTRIADGVSEKVDAYVRRPFVTRTIVETREGNDSPVLQLRHFPVQSVSQVRMRSSVAADWEVIDATEYVLDGFRGYLHLKTLTWPKVDLGNEITYSAGFAAQDSTDLPQDVVQTALDFVKFIYDRWKADTISLGSVSLQAAGSAVIIPALPADIKEALNPYVKRRL